MWTIGEAASVGTPCMGNPAGSAAIVVDIYDVGDGPSPFLLFPNGEYDGFGPRDITIFRVRVQGLVADGFARRYRFSNVGRLYADHADGRFRAALDEAERIVSAKRRLLTNG